MNTPVETGMMWQNKHESRFLRADPAAGRFQVNRSAFVDPNVFQEEKTKLLKRSWVFLGHESEVAKPGDYITRKILDYNLIFCKDRDNKVHAYFNSCTHRGATILRDPSGNKKSFTCPYHGWTFSNTGRLVDQSCQHGYPENFSADGSYNLVNVPRIESRRGFWFVNFDASGPNLTDYLGDAGDRIDMIADHSAAGLEVINGCHEYYIRANYKLMCENSYDGYHLNITHASYVDYMKTMVKGMDMATIDIRGGARSFGNGHACFELRIPTGRPVGMRSSKQA